MPTFETTARFRKDWALLSPEEKSRFRRTLEEEFIPDLTERRFRAGLRVKGIRGAPGIFEMTWAPDGRATWQYGQQLKPDDPHVIWRRVGTHDVFSAP